MLIAFIDSFLKKSYKLWANLITSIVILSNVISCLRELLASATSQGFCFAEHLKTTRHHVLIAFIDTFLKKLIKL